MNFHNSKSEILETSLENESEMYPCKLKESESKSNMALKKIGHELDMAETKCFTLKSELNYMMGVCRKAQTERGGRGTSEIPQELVTSFKNSDSKSSIVHYDCNNEVINKIRNYNILQKMHDVEEKTEENFDTLCASPRSVQFSPRKIADNDDVIGNIADLREEKQKTLMNITITPRAQLDKKFPFITPIQNETAEVDREYENMPCYPEHVEEHLQSVLSVEESNEELASKTDDDYFCMMSTKRDLPELNLKILNTAKGTVKGRRTKRKRTARVDKRETNSLYKVGDTTIPKVRKRKGKLQSSASKSTVTTKDTNYIGKREAKRRKHRGHGIINQQSNFSKHSRSSVVEIFHNTMLKSSNSAVSSKLDGQVKKHLTETVNEKIQEIPLSKCDHEFRNKDNQQNHHLQTLNYANNFKQTPIRSLLNVQHVQQQNKLEKHSNNNCLLAQGKVHQREHSVTFNKCNDPNTFTPNYEMSTLASRLKRSNRSYFSRFNFQNIPFVVGTSVTPSHNLGLNIQQVLSVMKTRQPIANTNTPLLIRKVSRGMKPASILLKQMNGYDEKSLLDASSQITGLFNNKENSGDDRDKKLSILDLQHAGKTQNIRMPNTDNTKMISGDDNDVFKRFHEEKNDFYENLKIKQQSLCVINKKTVSAMGNQQKISRLSLNKEDNIGDYKVNIPGTHNSKEIRDILINLHDQFEEMNTKYEKLQSEAEKKSDDASLTKELSTLEKELNVKEEEISAVIGLYKEVMMLKQQMKMLHERNSFVCIESPKEFRKTSFPISIIRGKPHSMNSAQIFERREAYTSSRKPPTSMQLIALLRQIQAFHKQLQLVS